MTLPLESATVSVSTGRSPALDLDLPRLDPLPYPVHFVAKDPKWRDLIDAPDFLDRPETFPVEALYARCEGTNDIWSAQAYVDLARSGLDVRLVDRLVPGAIHFITYNFLSARDPLHRVYVVACHHDSPRPFLCDQRVVLNHTKAGRDAHFLEHRPQPNLRVRDPARGARVENLVFKGEHYNLFAPFRAPEFLTALEALGVRLGTDTELDGSPFDNWANYAEADVVLAVRNNTRFDIALKPALKLINAWMAGCPALLSPEPSYRRLRRSRLDYVEVRTPEEALAAIRLLRDEPEIHLAMVKNGFRRAREHTVARAAAAWRALFAGPVAAGYERWRDASPLEKAARPARHLARAAAQRVARRVYKRRIHHGDRILTGPHPPLELPTLEEARAELARAD